MNTLSMWTDRAGIRKKAGLRRKAFLRPFVFALFYASLTLFRAAATPSWAEDPPLTYTVTITGVEEAALLAELKDASDSLALKDRPPPSVGLLRTRAERDRERFTRLLHGHGHFGARVEFSLDHDAMPLEVVFSVRPGPVYPLASVDIQITGEEEIPPHLVPSPETIGFGPGDPFKASALVEGERALVRAFEKKGFPFPRLEDRRIIVDHRDNTVAVAFFLDPGPRMPFGETRITGLDEVEESMIRRLIPWEEGDLFDVEQVESLQMRLFRLGLFSSVRVFKAPQPDQEGRLPMDIMVTERKHRSIGAGISFKTDEGPGATVLWEHRNLFGEGERLTLSGTGSDFTASAESTFLKPFFLRQDQSLRLLLRMAEDRPDPFRSRNIVTSATVARHLTEPLRVSAGLGFKASRVDQLDVRERFRYLFLPLDLEWDGSDDLLDPARGGRLGLYSIPFYDPTGENPAFLKNRIRYRHYVTPFSERPFVLAAGLSIGSITGAERDEIPADERFYAGGGGSIRGYAYQSVAPLRLGAPVGGRSLLEIALEGRLKVTERTGLVAFLDGGNAYENTLPDLGETLRWGAGVGFRYFTPVGPLRLDVAFPINRRPEIDDRFQIYVSLGQAF